MVLPVTGPIVGSYYGGNTSLPQGWRYATWARFRQKMPIDRPLRYSKVDRRCYYAFSKVGYGNCHNWRELAADPATSGELGYWDVLHEGDVESRQGVIIALNAASESFRGEIGKQAEWMVNAMQYNQALDLAARALTRLRRFSKAIRKADLDEAFRQFTPVQRLKAQQHGRNVKALASDLGGAWLSYSYGLKPLVQDVYNGIDIVTRSPAHRFTPKTGKGYSSIDLSGSYNYTTNTPVKWTNRGRVMSKAGGTVVITNPNVFALSSLGLTNPATWVWEMIPFSFIVDWFVNVGDVLSSMVPDLGFFVERPWSSFKVAVELEGRCTFDDASVPPPLDHQLAWVRMRMYAQRRYDALPEVKLVRTQKWLTSLPRALNAASLLAVQLKPGYRGPGRY